MPVPVSLRPDRREQVLTRNGWKHYTETREYRRKQRREEYEAKRAEEHARKQRIAAGMALLFGGD